MPTIDVVLNILIVLYLAIEEPARFWRSPPRPIRTASCGALPPPSGSPKGWGDVLAQSFEQTTVYRREKFLFAYVVDTLRRAGLTDLPDETSKYPILAAINLVNCIAAARRTTQ